MMTYLFIGTAVVWVGLFLWIFTALHRGQVNIQNELSDLQLELERIESCEKDS
jgi:CcmD family protein